MPADPSPPPIGPSRDAPALLERGGAFAAAYSALGPIGDRVRELAGGAGFDDTAAGEMELAVGEAVTNVITHALDRDPDRRFHLAGWAWPGMVEVVLLDDGPPFDPRAAPPPTLDGPLEERPEGGLGIHLMRSLTTGLDWHRHGGWNVLRLRREAPPATSH